METELTKKIKLACRTFKPAMNTKMRTIRYAEEVWTPTGIVDVIRFEDYIAKDSSYCMKLTPTKLDLKEWLNPSALDGKCKIDGQSYKNEHCRGCIYQRYLYQLDMLITCFEVKISVSDFKSKNGHNFHGNKNYYVVASSIYKDIKDLVPEGVGVIVYNEKSGTMRTKKECVFREVDDSIKSRLLYDALKKWCDGAQTTNKAILSLLEKYNLYDYVPGDLMKEFLNEVAPL